MTSRGHRRLRAGRNHRRTRPPQEQPEQIRPIPKGAMSPAWVWRPPEKPTYFYIEIK